MNHLWIPRLVLIVGLAEFAVEPVVQGADAASNAALPAVQRVLPPKGIELPAPSAEAIRRDLEHVKNRLSELRGKDLATSDDADVSIFAKAVEWALRFDEFYDPKDVGKAQLLLAEANKRLDELAQGKRSWHRATGTIVRGYRSTIDRSPQPFGLVIPVKHDFEQPSPLYVWLHGRGDKQTDMHFIHERLTKAGQITPPNAIVLHPFGRHCVAFKFAGETDVFEAIRQTQQHYRIDPKRIVLIGFSMGGAGAWHLGAHFPDAWVAVSPGAGFAESARYRQLKPEQFPADFERDLWGLYDVPGYTRNLFNVPVIAYSGEQDKQIQAARVMEEAFAAEGRTLPHRIGPGVGHKYEPKTLEQLLGELQRYVEAGTPARRQVHLQTRTLRYAQVDWIRVEGLGEHWKDARIDAEIVNETRIRLQTRNVTRLRVSSRPDMRGTTLDVDGHTVAIARGFPESGRTSAVVTKVGDTWREIAADGPGLRKRPLLQGPIDDAFSGPIPFVVVRPTSAAANEPLETWVAGEFEHAADRWRALMRGEPVVVEPEDATEYSAKGHIVAWGDPSNNRLLAQLNGQLPVTWHGQEWEFAGKRYDGRRYVPTFIYPNPLDNRYYLVVNSGLTFREAHDSTNSNQNPKLPDWAVIDLTQPANAESPGKIVEAGFFDEQWRVRGDVRSK